MSKPRKGPPSTQSASDPHIEDSPREAILGLWNRPSRVGGHRTRQKSGNRPLIRLIGRNLNFGDKLSISVRQCDVSHRRWVANAVDCTAAWLEGVGNRIPWTLSCAPQPHTLRPWFRWSRRGPTHTAKQIFGWCGMGRIRPMRCTNLFTRSAGFPNFLRGDGSCGHIG